jgi:hypothetical protein
MLRQKSDAFADFSSLLLPSTGSPPGFIGIAYRFRKTDATDQ